MHPVSPATRIATTGGPARRPQPARSAAPCLADEPEHRDTLPRGIFRRADDRRVGNDGAGGAHHARPRTAATRSRTGAAIGRHQAPSTYPVQALPVCSTPTRSARVSQLVRRRGDTIVGTELRSSWPPDGCDTPAARGRRAQPERRAGRRYDRASIRSCGAPASARMRTGPTWRARWPARAPAASRGSLSGPRAALCGAAVADPPQLPRASTVSTGTPEGRRGASIAVVR